MTAKTKLAETLSAGRPALTAECLPPHGADPGVVKKLAAAFPASLDAVVVADNPDGPAGSALACAAILAAENREPVLSIITRDRNRVAIESEILGAATLGVRAFLCLTGDHQSKGNSPQAAGVYDIDSIQLTQALKAMSESGACLNGRKLDAALQCHIGAAAHPYLRPMELNIIRLRKKIQAGAAFLLTQAVFDLAGFTEWMDAVRAAGLDKKAAIIASVLPLASVEKARELQAKGTYGPVPDAVIARIAKAPDAAKEGIAIAAEIAKKLKTVAGVRGIHILSGGCESAVARVIAEAGLAKA
jgi:methylenetetrahydrofolate reductase (NADPH)